ncbi:vesicle coat protein [Phyllosticta capitalensis]|uniref:Vesicle coat protein n=1 Tax=Phyllosticta capitalensis TaxID=121624 RepID=A0ABR1YYU4_9PEZI
MDFIISLAHFCEVHGPTSVLCTQITPSACATCHPCDTPPADDQPSKPSYFSNSLESLAVPSFSSPFETPPTSPRSPYNPHNPYFPTADKAIAGFGHHLGDADDACESCSFLVPKSVTERLPDGAPGSPSKDGKQNGSPVLRTTQSVMARGPRGSSDDRDTSSESSEEQSQASTSFSRSPTSLTSSPASPLFSTRSAHTHTLSYLSTRQPVSPSGYSRLRRTIIRTLSSELIPRGAPSGPIYFGDHVLGYSVAYLFRVPDACARGRRRTYALIALGGRDSCRVSKNIVKITEEFERIANDIVARANKTLEQETSLVSQPHLIRPCTSGPGTITPPLSSSGGSNAPPRRASVQVAASRPEVQSPVSATSSPSPPPPRRITPVSSFLTAKKVDPDGYPRVSRELMRNKGLAEMVGKEDYFVDLHAKFCVLLAGLLKESGTG